MTNHPLAKLTIYQAVFSLFLSQSTADYLWRDYLDWLDYFRVHGN